VLLSLRSLTQDRPFNLCPSSLSNSHLNVIWFTQLHTPGQDKPDCLSLVWPHSVPSFCSSPVSSFPLSIIPPVSVPVLSPPHEGFLNSQVKGARQLDSSIKGMCRTVFLTMTLERELQFDYLFVVIICCQFIGYCFLLLSNSMKNCHCVVNIKFALCT
jgi:hypothetical protein